MAIQFTKDPETGVMSVRERATAEELKTNAELIAKAFHEAYESLAPAFGWATQAASRVAWDDVPERNRYLMIATVATLLADGMIK